MNQLLPYLFNVFQTLYFFGFAVMLYFITRPINWVSKKDADTIPTDQLPSVILFYPVLKELEETMRSTMIGISKQRYPKSKYLVVALPNYNDEETITSLKKLQQEFDFLDLLVIPPTTASQWNMVWQQWDANAYTYWWKEGKYTKVKELPPKKTRQLIFAFYYYVQKLGTDWLLNYIDADSIPPVDHFLSGAAGIQKYDVLQSTNVAANLLQSVPAAFHAMDHMVWDGLIYPHMSADGKHPFWVLGKGLFFKAADLVEYGSFNPWITIEDPEIGMRLWAHGKKIGMIADPLVEEVPNTFKRGIIQRNRWICGFFQSLYGPTGHIGMNFWQRQLARINIIPVLFLMMNVIGLPLGIWSVAEFIRGEPLTSLFWAPLALINILLYALFMVVIYDSTWTRTGMVLTKLSDRIRYMLLVNPLFLWLYWLVWTVPICVGYYMFLTDRGKVWARTVKIDANHNFVRGKQV